MKHYNLMPVEGDWFNNEEVVSACGSLFPFITTKGGAVAYAKSVKERFPDITFQLTEGETWGNQKLIRNF